MWQDHEVLTLIKPSSEHFPSFRQVLLYVISLRAMLHYCCWQLASSRIAKRYLTLSYGIVPLLSEPARYCFVAVLLLVNSVLASGVSGGNSGVEGVRSALCKTCTTLYLHLLLCSILECLMRKGTPGNWLAKCPVQSSLQNTNAIWPRVCEHLILTPT